MGLNEKLMCLCFSVYPAGGASSEEDNDDEDDEFHDAISEQTEEFKVCLPPDRSHRYRVIVIHMIYIVFF